MEVLENIKDYSSSTTEDTGAFWNSGEASDDSWNAWKIEMPIPEKKYTFKQAGQECEQ